MLLWVEIVRTAIRIAVICGCPILMEMC